MKKLEGRTVIGEVECAGCGAKVPLKVNVNQCVYYYCSNVLERDENGKITEICKTRHNIGRAPSRKLIKEYLDKQGTTNEDLEHRREQKEESDIVERGAEGSNVETNESDVTNGADEGRLEGGDSREHATGDEASEDNRQDAGRKSWLGGILGSGSAFD